MRVAWVKRFRSFDRRQLLEALRDLGVRDGDALLLHSAFSEASGFRGTIDDLIDVYLEAVGPTGHLLMVSLPYRDSAFAYLQRMKRFDVRRTPSMMGMVSELFRRRPGVLRSLHPTHPILVAGPRASWFVEGHEHCVHPCGPGTPFERLVQAQAKVAFFNVPFATYTFFHYLEHLVSKQVPFDIYTQQIFEVPVVDAQGGAQVVRTHAFEPSVIARRRFNILETALRAHKFIHTCRLGASQLELTRVEDSIACVLAMAAEGRFFYDMT